MGGRICRVAVVGLLCSGAGCADDVPFGGGSGSAGGAGLDGEWLGEFDSDRPPSAIVDGFALTIDKIGGGDIEDEQRPMLLRQAPQSLQERPVRRQHSRRAHHRLDDHRRDLPPARRQQPLGRRDVIERRHQHVVGRVAGSERAASNTSSGTVASFCQSEDRCVETPS